MKEEQMKFKVIDDKGRDSKSKKYMWMYKIGGNYNSIILYDYQQTKSSSCHKNFFGDYSEYIQTDGYTGYNKVEKAKIVY